MLPISNKSDALSNKAKVACVFGNPIEQSKSPTIHSCFAKQFDIKLDYQKRLAGIYEFADSADTFFNNPQSVGANVTMPFKEEAVKWVSELSNQATRAGAVNTITRTANGFVGDNTDGIGLVNDLRRHGVLLAGSRLLLIGAGGAAKGALPALLESGIAYVSLYNRNDTKAGQLIEHTQSYSAQHIEQYKSKHNGFDLIVNATSLSLSEQLPDLPDSIFDSLPTVYDMVYKNQPTIFLKHAKQLGCNATFDGLGMLVEQAAHSFYLWFGVKPETGSVLEYLRSNG